MGGAIGSSGPCCTQATKEVVVKCTPSNPRDATSSSRAARGRTAGGAGKDRKLMGSSASPADAADAMGPVSSRGHAAFAERAAGICRTQIEPVMDRSPSNVDPVRPVILRHGRSVAWALAIVDKSESEGQTEEVSFDESSDASHNRKVNRLPAPFLRKGVLDVEGEEEGEKQEEHAMTDD
uniref:Uncharacterized protein n=1 Tax=Pyrodinium bahamense TaxID=73915 RepID=A0A7S0AGE1_9DINO|mmetsp:Transcript_34006/g.94130  ORF Transcript_34006/g.94130 Transcript_34006/m.94130 type:complete len:180 (+) Transcript_34006:72-611(+)